MKTCLSTVRFEYASAPGENFRVVTIISVCKYFGDLRLELMYSYMHMRNSEMIGADIFPEDIRFILGHLNKRFL